MVIAQCCSARLPISYTLVHSFGAPKPRINWKWQPVYIFSTAYIKRSAYKVHLFCKGGETSGVCKSIAGANTSLLTMRYLSPQMWNLKCHLKRDRPSPHSTRRTGVKEGLRIVSDVWYRLWSHNRVILHQSLCPPVTHPPHLHRHRLCRALFRDISTPILANHQPSIIQLESAEILYDSLVPYSLPRWPDVRTM